MWICYVRRDIVDEADDDRQLKPNSITLTIVRSWLRTCSKLVRAKFHYTSWFRAGSEQAPNQLRTSSELPPNMFGASSEPASIMEFGFKLILRLRKTEPVTSIGRYRWKWRDDWRVISKAQRTAAWVRRDVAGQGSWEGDSEHHPYQLAGL